MTELHTSASTYYGQDTLEGFARDAEILKDLRYINNMQMKKGKACNTYKLTAELLKFCGEGAQLVLLNLMNDIIEHIYYLTCPQIKEWLGTAVYKGKRKPNTEANSYRRITVSPLIGSILDRFIDPLA